MPRPSRPASLSLRTVAMPADTNPAGDIFGGWIMSLMDLAAGVSAGTRAKGRVATAAVSNLSFLQPVKVGDVVCVYTNIVRTGRSSITLGVEAWVLRRGQGERVRVTAAEFVTGGGGRCRQTTAVAGGGVGRAGRADRHQPVESWRVAVPTRRRRRQRPIHQRASGTVAQLG